MSSAPPALFSGAFHAVPASSTVSFAVLHSQVFRYRGTLSDVTATLRTDGDELVLEGSARPESISVAEPPPMRASVLGPEFFDVERHPEVTFRSTALRLADDLTAAVDGELTIRGTTVPVTGHGSYAPPRESSFGVIAGLHLQTRLDRRGFGFEWQAELPGGGEAVSWDVDVEIDLLLMAERTDGETS